MSELEPDVYWRVPQDYATLFRLVERECCGRRIGELWKCGQLIYMYRVDICAVMTAWHAALLLELLRGDIDQRSTRR